MPKKKQKKQSWLFWFGVGLVAALLTAPNMTVLKVLVDDIEPLTLNTIRAAILVAITLPFVVASFHKFTRRNFRYAVIAAISMTIAITSAIYALKYSQASYVVILALLSPIVLVLLSRRIVGEKINFRAAAGITVAALGALTAVALPLMLSGGATMAFYPLATALIAINCIFFPLGIIYMRKSHEAGLPLTAVSGVTSMSILLVCGGLMYFLYGLPTNLGDFSVGTWSGILYSAVIVAFLARIMSVASYERIGSVTSGGLSYIHTVVAIIIPVVILGEQLSIAVVAGGALILLGVYLTERHHIKHYPHIRMFHHH